MTQSKSARPADFIKQWSAAIKSNDLPSALQLTKDGLRIYPNNSDLTRHLAHTYHRIGEIKEAIESAMKAVSLDPSDPNAHLLLATFLSAQGFISEAKYHLGEVLRLKPDNILGLNYSSQLALRQNDINLAHQQADRLIKIYPNSPLGYQARANAHLAQEEYDFARVALQRAQELSPPNEKTIMAKIFIIDNLRES